MANKKLHISSKVLNPFKGDLAIWVIFIILSVISLIWVYSSIGLSAATNDQSPHMAGIKHMMFVLAAYFVIIAVSNLNYRNFAAFSWWGFLIVAILLVFVLILGRHTNYAGSGMSRWIRLPIIGRFQPSELAKVVVLVYLARLLTINKETLNERRTFIIICIPVLLVCGLIYSNNLSTAIIIGATSFITMRFAGVSRKHWWLTILAIAVVGLIVILVSTNMGDKGPVQRSETWTNRVGSWQEQDMTKQTQDNLARMAVASGKLLGKGVGTTILARIMTQADNDFIYAIIIEERGAILGVFIFLLYAILYLRCIRIAWKCKGTFGQLIVIGLGTLIFVQAAIHMGVNVGALPVTGQTLPFISSGGTSYLCMALSLGIIQSVAADTAALENKGKSSHRTKAPTEASEKHAEEIKEEPKEKNIEEHDEEKPSEKKEPPTSPESVESLAFG